LDHEPQFREISRSKDWTNGTSYGASGGSPPCAALGSRCCLIFTFRDNLGGSGKL
jgi:hypothetical protein